MRSCGPLAKADWRLLSTCLASESAVAVLESCYLAFDQCESDEIARGRMSRSEAFAG